MSRTVLSRVLLSVLVGALCGVGLACAVVVLDRPDGVRLVVGQGDARPSLEASAAAGPRDVLRQWDAARARAWTTADAEALARLYTPSSRAGRRDVAMLRAWQARGVRLTGLSTHVLDLRVVVARDRLLVLEVTDRVTYAASAAGTLPTDQPSTRRVELVRRDAGWVVAAVSEPPNRSR
jgi:hypothetical protein